MRPSFTFSGCAWKKRNGGSNVPGAPVDEISWKVGYEDPAFFRRLFKRITGVTAGAYRRKFQIPDVESL
jgi:AraC-like DNA-binding protein